MSAPLRQISVKMSVWGALPASAPSLLRDLPVMLAGLALFYALLSLAH